jgi:ABC-type long-subunit fatty acid transport system fused permease/ATPase subunit
VVSIADGLSRNLNIQEDKEEALKLLSGLGSKNISSIKSTILMHTPLIFKESAKVKQLRFVPMVKKSSIVSKNDL